MSFHLYLASGSPRRSEILERFKIPFTLIPQDFDESQLSFNAARTPRHYACDLAQQKALSVRSAYPSWILTADTIVVLKKRLLGKPSSLQEAFKTLSLLQNNTHHVITAFCLYHHEKQRIILRSRSSKVTFNSLSKADIEDYVTKKKPLDKAGAYGIQECPPSFIKSFTGSKYTIMGLPIEALRQAIKDIQPDLHSL